MAEKKATRAFRDLELWSLFVVVESPATAVDPFQKCDETGARRVFYQGREAEGLKALRWKEDKIIERFAPDVLVTKISTTILPVEIDHPGVAVVPDTLGRNRLKAVRTKS